jgi:hypothetical protein
LHDGQADVSDPTHITEGGLTVKDNGDALFTESAVGVTRDQAPAIASQNFADVSSPAAAVTYPMTLFAQDALVSHIYLSTLKTGDRWEIAPDCSLLRRPGELRESRGFASLPHGRFAFSVASGATMTV